MSTRSKFERTPHRKIKKLYVVSTEGSITEHQYLEYFKNCGANIQFIRKKHKCSPHDVLKEMRSYLKKNKLKNEDEAWIVIDKDYWPEKQIKAIINWATQNEQFNFSISVPNFEYYLLLHFEDGENLSSSNLSARLKRHLPEYNKSISMAKLSLKIEEAINRAKRRPQDDINSHIPYSTVYVLIESLLKEIKNLKE